MKLYRKTYAQIDLSAYKYNLQVLGEAANTDIMAIIKADAYGHGASQMAIAAISAGAKVLGVALPEEALELRQEGIVHPILVLGRANPDQAELSVSLGLEQCVFTKQDVGYLQKYAKELRKTANIHIKIDTGMGRLGVRSIEQLDDLLAFIATCPNVELTGVFTHFSSADEQDQSFTQQQYLEFCKYMDFIREAGYSPKIHASNSAACINYPEYALDFVRCGISSYGYYSSDYIYRNRVELKPVMQIFSEVSHVKNVPENTPIGYNRAFITERETKVATVQIGYGDGYPRLLSNKGKMLLYNNGQLEYANIIGKVCMDQTMIDVSHFDHVQVGDQVCVLGGTGANNFLADDIAQICDTISYEVLTSFTSRIPRLYVK